MKRVEIIVEGQTEQEFVKELIKPFLLSINPTIYVTPILIRTSSNGRGGFSNYQHLKNDITRTLSSRSNDLIVSMFVDFFRIPTSVPKYKEIMAKGVHLDQVAQLEAAIDIDIKDRRFIPYIQLHEFEALLFSSNIGFENYFIPEHAEQTNIIVTDYDNPEEINSSPETAPSKRLIKIKSDYDKALEGNLIALEVGMTTIMQRCPRFKSWIDLLVQKINE